MITRLIINSWAGNTTPTESMLLDRQCFPGKWRTVFGTTGDASEIPLREENCLWGEGGGSGVCKHRNLDTAFFLVSYFSPSRSEPRQKEQQLHRQRTAGPDFARSKK